MKMSKLTFIVWTVGIALCGGRVAVGRNDTVRGGGRSPPSGRGVGGEGGHGVRGYQRVLGGQPVVRPEPLDPHDAAEQDMAPGAALALAVAR